MKIKPTGWSCDFCTAAEPLWRYALPGPVEIMTTRDAATGRIDQLRSTGLGACEECAKPASSAGAATIPWTGSTCSTTGSAATTSRESVPESN